VLAGDEGLQPEEVTRPIHVHCTADAFNLKKLATILRREFPNAEIHSISECVHCRVREGGLVNPPEDVFGDMFFFEVRLRLQHVNCSTIFRCGVCLSSLSNECHLETFRFCSVCSWS
jgi:hypothetical protein